MTHKLSMITHLIALLLPLLAVFSSCKGEEPIEPQEPEEPIHVAVESVELNEHYLTLRVGEEAPLIAFVYPSDATDQSLDWESDDQDVAAFYFNGRDGFFYVHANGAGSTIVRVKTYDGGYIAECQVEVLPREVSDVVLSERYITLNIGDEYQLTAKVFPPDANQNLVWSSNNTSVATVSDGKVTAIKAGKSTITVQSEDGKHGDICDVTVRENNIEFADSWAKSWCVENFDTNADGEISYDEAAAVQDLTGLNFHCFIKTFDEFQYFINVTSIPDKFFATNPSSSIGLRLESIILPKSIKSIGEKAFFDCKTLTKIELPEGLESIGDRAFYYCAGLTEVKFPKSLKYIRGFYDCAGLTKIEFSEGVENIHDFYGCTGLTEVKFPKSLKYIWGFTQCTGLTKVEFSEGVEYINGFWRCTGLTEVELPKSLKTIASNAFYDCTGLTKVYCKPLTPPAVDRQYDSAPVQIFADYCRIYVPRNSVELYKDADGWKDCDIRGYDF